MGKTLGDIQEYIVKVSVGFGSHPSNPWMAEALDQMSHLGEGEMTNDVSAIPEEWKRILRNAGMKTHGENGILMKKIDPKKRRQASEDAVKRLEAEEKKEHENKANSKKKLLKEKQFQLFSKPQGGKKND